jgi:hypothetical protein
MNGSKRASYMAHSGIFRKRLDQFSLPAPMLALGGKLCDFGCLEAAIREGRQWGESAASPTRFELALSANTGLSLL